MVSIIPKLKCDLKFGLPVLGVLGIVYSIWASNYLILTILLCTWRYDSRRDQYFLEPAQQFYLLVCIAASILLYRGFQNNDKNLIKYWLLQKWIELSFIVIGSVLILFSERSLYWNWPCLIVGVVILGIGYYLLDTVKQGYKELGIELDCIRIPDVFKRTKNQNDRPPPPYEEVENRDNNLGIKS